MTPIKVEVISHLDVLKAIAEDRLPCRTCGKVHTTHPVTRNLSGEIFTYDSWADPVDNHSYFRMSPAQYAKSFLEQEQASCICTRFSDTGGFRLADLACPVHGIDGTDPGDGWWDDPKADHP